MLEVIDKKYQLLRPIGKGGNGSVYVAWNKSLQKEVAIKILTETSPDGSEIKRFQQEARALSTCNHPGIVRVSSFGLTDDKRLYYVMDYVQGHSLATEIKENGPLSPPRFAKLFDDILAALEHAHSLGLIHRDLKPANIMLTRDSDAEHAVLIDFGLTRFLEKSVKLTATDALIGTPHYMSPEQCLNKPVDQRGDLYSLGCTMLEAATGRPPFSGEAVEVLMAHLHQAPDTVPSELIPLLNGLLAKDPDNRFPSAAHARECLHSLKLNALTQFSTGRHCVGDVSATCSSNGLKRVRGVVIQALGVLFFIGVAGFGAYSGLSVWKVKTEAQQEGNTKPSQVTVPRWTTTSNAAADLRKSGNFAESAKLLRVAIQQSGSEEPDRKSQQVKLIGDLMDVSSAGLLPSAVWADQAEAGITLAEQRNNPQAAIELLIQAGKLYAMHGDVLKARSAFYRSFALTEKLPSNTAFRKSAAYLAASRSLAGIDGISKAQGYLKRAIQILLEQERVSSVMNSWTWYEWENDVLNFQLPFEFSHDQPFVGYARRELARPVDGNPIRKARRYVYLAKFDLYANDKNAAKEHFDEAEAIALSMKERPHGLAAFVLHSEMPTGIFSPAEELAAAKRALQLCLEPPSTNAYFPDATYTAYCKLAGVYEARNENRKALAMRLCASKVGRELEQSVAAPKDKFDWCIRSAWNTNLAIYNAKRAGDIAQSKKLSQEGEAEAEKAEALYRTELCKQLIAHTKQELRRAEQGLNPAP